MRAAVRGLGLRRSSAAHTVTITITSHGADAYCGGLTKPRIASRNRYLHRSLFLENAEPDRRARVPIAFGSSCINIGSRSEGYKRRRRRRRRQAFVAALRLLLLLPRLWGEVRRGRARAAGAGTLRL